MNHKSEVSAQLTVCDASINQVSAQFTVCEASMEPELPLLCNINHSIEPSIDNLMISYSPGLPAHVFPNRQQRSSNPPPPQLILVSGRQVPDSSLDDKPNQTHPSMNTLGVHSLVHNFWRSILYGVASPGPPMGVCPRLGQHYKDTELCKGMVSHYSYGKYWKPECSHINKDKIHILVINLIAGKSRQNVTFWKM